MALLKNIKSTPDQLVQTLSSEDCQKVLLKDIILGCLYNKRLNDNYQLEKIDDFYNKSFNINGDTILIERDIRSDITTDSIFFNFDILDLKKLSQKCRINNLLLKNYFDYEVHISKLIGDFENNFEINPINSSSRCNIWFHLNDINKLPKFGSNVNLYRTCFRMDDNLGINEITEGNLDSIQKILNHFDNYINGDQHKKLFLEKGIHLHPGDLHNYGFPDTISQSLYHRVTDFLQDNVGLRGGDKKSKFCNKFFLEILPAGVPIYFKSVYTEGVTIIRCSDKDNFKQLVDTYTKVGTGSRKNYNFTKNKKFIIIGN